MKSTAIAPSNIAFVKYWGKRDENLRIPTNGSISMNLSNLTTTTTIEFSNRLKTDEIGENEMSNPYSRRANARPVSTVKTVRDFSLPQKDPLPQSYIKSWVLYDTGTLLTAGSIDLEFFKQI
mgnify:CR=1 FL=1